MDSKDEELKRALDEIFGDNENALDEVKEESEDDKLISLEFDTIDTDDSKEKSLDISFNDNETLQEEVINENLLNDEDIKENEVSKKEGINVKKIIIYFIAGFIIGLLLLWFLMEKQEINKTIVNCSMVKEDDNYKETIEYKITKKENEITYVVGSYAYLAKTDEYKSKTESVKEEKIPIIVNSNGMKGFTYEYEISSKLFKMHSYLNYEEFDLDVIKKIDQEKVPISLFKIDLEKKYDELQKTLKKDGFICTTSN